MFTFLDTATLSFYISFLGIVGLISLKNYEIKNNKKFFTNSFALRIDKFIVYLYDGIKNFIYHINRANAIALIQWIAYHILSWARNTYIWLYKKARSHPPSKKVVDMVRGKVEIKKKGGISFYLRRIGEKDEEVLK